MDMNKPNFNVHIITFFDPMCEKIRPGNPITIK